MSEAAAIAPGKAPSMGVFERYLTLWVALCIVVGVALGQAVPGLFHALGAATAAEVNLPVAALVWLMIVPMLLKIDLAALGQIGSHWRGIAATVGVNWLVKPQGLRMKSLSPADPRGMMTCPRDGEGARHVDREAGAVSRHD